MKILHLSDLHLGKKVNEFPMLSDQQYILNQILNIADNENPDCVIIAGDIYDRPTPSAEAIRVFDNFLFGLSERKLSVFIISGNHDMAERISFGGRLMKSSNIYIAPVFNGKIIPVELKDEYGNINFYMIPFIKPINVRKFYPDETIENYTDAMKIVIENMNINSDSRNILITHQFITGASFSESEEFSVGGTENIDAEIFDDFDYIALGHIHRPQNVRDKRIRYCGSPLKYSSNEENQQKSVTIVEMGEKGNLEIRTIPLIPERDMKFYKGTYKEITDPDFYGNIKTDDYIFITLTDEEDIPDANRKLRKIYPYMMQLSYDNSRTRNHSIIKNDIRNEKNPPIQLFSEFYEAQCNHKMSSEQYEFVDNLIKEVWEEIL